MSPAAVMLLCSRCVALFIVQAFLRPVFPLHLQHYILQVYRGDLYGYLYTVICNDMNFRRR